MTERDSQGREPAGDAFRRGDGGDAPSSGRSEVAKEPRGAGESSGAEASSGAKKSSGAKESPELEEEREAEAELKAELDHLEEEFEGLKDRHLRLAADFDNYRRRAENEMTESWVRAQADLVRRLLDALDDLQRVTELNPEETSMRAIFEGVQLVERKLVQAMRDAGVEVVEPEGEDFDPSLMEAMMRVPAESADEDDRVERVFQKGYTFKGHLVRPARVSVLKYDG